MDTITKQYKGVELTLSGKKHGKTEMKFSIAFSLNGSGYTNARVLPVTATDQQTSAALGELEKWARGVINENINE